LQSACVILSQKAGETVVVEGLAFFEENDFFAGAGLADSLSCVEQDVGVVRVDRQLGVPMSRGIRVGATAIAGGRNRCRAAVKSRILS
jgi:hypothetical protein